MAKSLTDILKGVKKSKVEAGSTGDQPGVDYAPKSQGDRDFVASHKVEKHEDRVGNDDKLYKASNVKRTSMKNHGHPSRKDEAQYKQNNEETELSEAAKPNMLYQGKAVYIKRGGPSKKNPGTVSIADTKEVEHNVPFTSTYAGSRPSGSKIINSVKQHERHSELTSQGWEFHKWVPKPGFDTRKKITEEVEMPEDCGCEDKGKQLLLDKKSKILDAVKKRKGE